MLLVELTLNIKFRKLRIITQSYLTKIRKYPVNLRVSNYFKRSKKIEIFVNNESLEAYEGECLALVLYINNIKNLRLSPKNKDGRGMFCLMGSCQECVVLIDGMKVTSCNVFIKEGMNIKIGDLDEL